MTASDAARRRHEQWLLELTALPTAAGCEGRVIDWVRAWVARRKDLRLRADRAGNLVITTTPRPAGRPVFFTAHLDHPAFVVREPPRGRDVELEFRGGVHDPYFDDAQIEIFDAAGCAHPARITGLDSRANPFKHATARLTRNANAIAPGDVGRWRFRGTVPRISRGRLHTHACDDLAAAVAALAALDRLRRRRTGPPVGVLFTRAEEVGFIGAIEACRLRTVPRTSRLVCLENSRSFAESPIGAGPILRVGDRLSVFEPRLTNRLGGLFTAHASRQPSFRWQRKLMAGGACEATAFAAYGYESTCLCLPLGNYHNMTEIDAVLAGHRPAKVGPECISLDDFHGLVEMLMICARDVDDAAAADIADRLEHLRRERGHVLAR
jgi:endoglucanase